MKLAAISDIHGNSVALLAVLKDIQQEGVTEIINLGDSLYGPLDPAGTVDLLIDFDVISIKGNQDRFIIENMDIQSSNHTLEYVKAQMDEGSINWLKQCPARYSWNRNVFAFHGSPYNDSIYFLESLNKSGVRQKAIALLDDELHEVYEPFVLCGHSHMNRTVQSLRHTIVNPGSVGLPAYNDDLPIAHKMENLSPHARYCILDFSKDQYKVEHRKVEYDYEIAASLAEQNNRPDWAKWIRTGVA